MGLSSRNRGPLSRNFGRRIETPKERCSKQNFTGKTGGGCNLGSWRGRRGGGPQNKPTGAAQHFFEQRNHENIFPKMFLGRCRWTRNMDCNDCMLPLQAFKSGRHLRSWPSCTILVELALFSVHKHIFGTQVLKRARHVAFVTWNMPTAPSRLEQAVRYVQPHDMCPKLQK